MTPQCRDPEKLCPCVRELCDLLLKEAKKKGIRLTLIETLRALDRQEYYIRIGASRTMKSMHLPQPPNKLALAFDVCPTPYLSERAWHPDGEYWNVLGEIGDNLGLEWGGHWKSFQDHPHFQLRDCQC